MKCRIEMYVNDARLYGGLPYHGPNLGRELRKAMEVFHNLDSCLLW
jgi:hypothetical protein